VPEKASTSDVTQPLTDDSIRVRHLSHYQFSWVAQEPGESGVFTLQLVLDQGAWEEVLTVDADDADVLRELLPVTRPARIPGLRASLVPSLRSSLRSSLSE
jgi:hypothetical protein